MQNLAVIVLLLAPTLAAAQSPLRLGYQGRLLNADGTPATGTPIMTFKLCTSPTCEPAVWTEQQTIALTDGFYAVHLGDNAALPEALFDGSELYLELSIDNEVFTPRQRVTSVASAAFANNARNVVGGRVDATSISIDGVPLLDPSGRVGIQYVDDSKLQRRVNGSCADGFVTSIARDGGVSCTAIDPSRFQERVNGACAAGFVTAIGQDGGVSCTAIDPALFQQRIGGVCASGFVTAIGQDGGVTCTAIDPSQFQQRISGACAAGFVTAIGQDGGVTCTAIDPSQFQQRIGGTCASGFVTAVGLDGGVICATEDPAFQHRVNASCDGLGFITGIKVDGSVSCSGDRPLPNGGLMFKDQNYSIKVCDAGKILKANSTQGWDCDVDQVSPTYGGRPNGGIDVGVGQIGLSQSCGAGQVLASQGSGNWACAQQIVGPTYRALSPLELVDNVFSIAPCRTGESLQWTGASWNCAVGAVSAGAGLTLGTGNAMSVAAGEGQAITLVNGQVAWKTDATGGLSINSKTGGAQIRSCDSSGQVLVYNTNANPNPPSWDCQSPAQQAVPTDCTAPQVLNGNGNGGFSCVTPAVSTQVKIYSPGLDGKHPGCSDVLTTVNGKDVVDYTDCPCPDGFVSLLSGGTNATRPHTIAQSLAIDVGHWRVGCQDVNGDPLSCVEISVVCSK